MISAASRSTPALTYQATLLDLDWEVSEDIIAGDDDLEAIWNGEEQDLGVKVGGFWCGEEPFFFFFWPSITLSCNITVDRLLRGLSTPTSGLLSSKPSV